MAVAPHRILHRKDETGVIVESGVFGPDDEVPEGFGPQEFEVVEVGTRIVNQAESEVKPWDGPLDVQRFAQENANDEVNDGTPVQARRELNDAESEALELVKEAAARKEDDMSELNAGSPIQARQQAEDGELTDAEVEAEEKLDKDAKESAKAESKAAKAESKDAAAEKREAAKSEREAAKDSRKAGS